MRKKVCVVAGGAGFIGVNLVSALLDRNYNVVVGDDLSLGSFNNLVKHTVLDLQDCLQVVPFFSAFITLTSWIYFFHCHV